MAALEDKLKAQAHRLGFDLVGIAPATPADRDSLSRLHDWMEQGFAGEMSYMHRHAEALRDPRSVFPAVRAVIMVAMNYFPGRAVESPPHFGRVARYAQGADYHDALRERLCALLDWLQEAVPECHGRGVVDTAPLLERDFARRAGLGWFGKNTMLLNKRLGSYFFLGALLVSLDLQPDPPHEGSHCGTCTACLDACPTQAFTEPGTLDSRRCISYLTIELRGAVPTEWREALGAWLFGCDICQEVCPWNRKAPMATEPALVPRHDLEAVDPAEIVTLTEAEFRDRFRGTALTRARRRGLARNAAFVLGNQGDEHALPALERALDDPESIVREAATWAIAQIQRRLSTNNTNNDSTASSEGRDAVPPATPRKKNLAKQQNEIAPHPAMRENKELSGEPVG